VAVLTITKREPVKGRFDMEPTNLDYEALGRFVSSCSVIEITMHRLIRAWLNIQDDIARQLIGEPRAGDLLDLAKFALARFDLTEDDKSRLNQILPAAFDACRQLNSIRAVVAHKPFRTDGFTLLFYNRVTAKKIASAYEWECTTKQLFAASEYALEVAHILVEAVNFSPLMFSLAAQLPSSPHRSALPSIPDPNNRPRPVQPPPPRPSRPKHSSKKDKA
jgi:hypothetical protein